MAERFAQGSSDASPQRRLALRFISGKYQGGEVPLAEGDVVVVGRSSDLDMVLVEEMVSRRHARITFRSGSVIIEDLGSTNGTFVNGEKIRRAEVREGDRILIGTSILKLIAAAPSEASGARDLEAVAGRRATQRQPGVSRGESPRMSGELEEIPLPDLLQLFGTSRKTATLHLETPHGVGDIRLNNGTIVDVGIATEPLDPLKAAYRMLTWTSGTFELQPSDPTDGDTPLTLAVQELLMEGFRQQDELSRIEPALPPRHARLILRTPLEAPLHELEPENLEVLQRALNSPTFQALLDRSHRSDLAVATAVLELMKRGYLTSVVSS